MKINKFQGVAIFIFIVFLANIIFLVAINFDVNGDSSTDIDDLISLVTHYRGTYNATYDFNGDSSVDLFDVVALAKNISLETGQSLAFPASTSPPSVEDFLPEPVAERYCSSEGSNTLGNGTFENPWYDLIGASSGGSGSPVVPGTILYFRGGTYNAYSYVNFAKSQNALTVSGTAALPIVITNYPDEIVIWNDTDETWALTLDGDYQKMIGTKDASGNYGFKIQGGISLIDDYERVSGVEFIGGTYNGGDNNPAMLSVPLNDGCFNPLISHNYFRNSENPPSTDRMNAIRFFTATNAVVEHNLFEDNLDLYQGGVINFKDHTENATIKYNKFINNAGGISYVVQGDSNSGIDIHHNLFYGATGTYGVFTFLNDLGENILVHDNVALEIGSSFFYYLNGDNQDWGDGEHGSYYNNVINGTGFAQGWSGNSGDLKNIPDLFDYNLWYDGNDMNDPFDSEDFPPISYHQNSIISSGAITYDAENLVAYADADYAGISMGRYGDDIGGFEWT